MGGSAKIYLMTAVLGTALFAAHAHAGEPTTAIKTEKDKVNYAIGVNIIGNIKKQGIDIDLDLVVQGMKDANAGGKLLLSDDELRKAISRYYTAVRQNQSKAWSKAAEEKKAKGLSTGPSSTAPAAAGNP
jgi:FKBP-type peptidyl-prolyl cis-trans isomerase FklB